MAEEKNRLECYEIIIDGNPCELYIGRDDATRAMKMHLDECEEDVSLHRFKNLRQFVEEYADFEDPEDDEWMQTVLENTVQMIWKAQEREGERAHRSKDLLEKAAEGTSGMAIDEIAAEHAEEPKDE